MPVVIGGDNLPSPVRIGLNDLQNIGGATGPPGPPGSGTTATVGPVHFELFRPSVIRGPWIMLEKYVVEGLTKN